MNPEAKAAIPVTKKPRHQDAVSPEVIAIVSMRSVRIWEVLLRGRRAVIWGIQEHRRVS